MPQRTTLAEATAPMWDRDPKPKRAPTPAVTRRVLRRIIPRTTAFLDWTTGEGITDDGRAWHLGAHAPVARIVEHAAVEKVARVMLTGPRPHAADPDLWRAWSTAAPEGWEIGHHDGTMPILRFRDEVARVEVMRAAMWWGSEIRSPDVCRLAWLELAAAIGDRWPGAVLMTTPATTGRDLLARSIPEGTEWPCLPDDLAQLIRETSGQGRIQWLGTSARTLDAVYGYDGRVMYAALCRELPGGRCEHIPGEPSSTHARCRVRATWTVPEDWRHVGLLGMRDDNGGWTYPDRPGERGTGWIDGAELHMARRWGWSVKVHEALIWPQRAGRAGPLDGWSKRLVDLLALYRPVAATDPVAYAVGRALRQIIITTVGALVGTGQVVTRATPLGDPIPADAVSPHVADGVVMWGERRPAAWPQMVHPEWSAAVWARCRARILDGPPCRGRRTGALHVHPDHLLAIRTDALYVTSDPRWPDDGGAGRLRRTMVRRGPLRAPQSPAELLALRDGA